MKRASRALAVVATILLFSAARGEPLYGLHWVSDPQPCKSGGVANLNAQAPVISAYYPKCEFRDQLVSICCHETVKRRAPWSEGALISIVGYSMSMVLTDRKSQGIAEVGNHHPGSDAADIFGLTSGTGTNTTSAFFPPGVAIPQGGQSDDHFDVYAACDSGSFQVLLDIFYKSP
jgi:hypothetical protein